MTGRQWLVVVVVVLAVVGGGIVAFSALGGGGSPQPSSAATASATPSASGAAATSTTAPATPTPAGTPTAAPTAAPAPSLAPSAAPSATPTPTNAPGPEATITLTQLTLDAKDDPEGQDRVVTFESGGTGTITVALRTLSSQGSALMCLSADGKALGCRTTTDGKLTADTTKKAASFELTLRGDGNATPMVEVEVTFPASKPSVTIANARFDGTMYPETNGIQAIVQPRADGSVHLTADWGGHPFLYEVDLQEQGGSGSQTLANQGPATRTDEKLPVTAPNPWKVVLRNSETGFGTTPMTVTIAWP